MRRELQISAIALLLTFVLLSGCGRCPSAANSAPNHHDDSQASADIRMENHGDQLVASPSSHEARQWIKQQKHLFFTSDTKVVAQFVEDFYNAGASKVLIGDCEQHDGNEYAGSILVVLPEDDAAREKLFDVGMRADIVFGQDPVIDKGQKYLYYTPN